MRTIWLTCYVMLVLWLVSVSLAAYVSYEDFKAEKDIKTAEQLKAEAPAEPTDLRKWNYYQFLLREKYAPPPSTAEEKALETVLKAALEKEGYEKINVKVNIIEDDVDITISGQKPKEEGK